MMAHTPKKLKTAFKAGSDRGNVILNFAGKPDDEFAVYGEAFRRAADDLTRSLAKNPAYDHYDACPIVFLYRHAIELYLKAILKTAPSAWFVSNPPFDEAILGLHPLGHLVSPLRKVFAALGWSEAFDDCEAFVNELDGVDPISFAFRYPVKKKTKKTKKTSAASLPDYFVFNVLDFAKRATKVLEILYELVHGIAAHHEVSQQFWEDSGEW